MYQLIISRIATSVLRDVKHILWSGHHVSSLKNPNDLSVLLLHIRIFSGWLNPPTWKKSGQTSESFLSADSVGGNKKSPKTVVKLDTTKRPGGWRKSPRDESTATIAGCVNSHCFPMVGMVINLIVGVYNGPICKDSLWKVGWPSPYIRSLVTLAHLVRHIKASCGSMQYQKTHAFLVQIFCGRFWSMSSRLRKIIWFMEMARVVRLLRKATTIYDAFLRSSCHGDPNGNGHGFFVLEKLRCGNILALRSRHPIHQ